MSSSGLEAALRAAQARTGKPSDDDRPRRVTVLPGKKVKPLEGQLDLDGRVYNEWLRRTVETPEVRSAQDARRREETGS